MIRTTPFHERLERAQRDRPVGALVGLPGRDRATRCSDKFEYFAIRNSAGLFDTSPLFKYRIHGPDAERFLAGVLARDIRTCPPGHAQYTVWCDDRGLVVEDGVVLRHGAERVRPHRGRAEPRLLRGADRSARRRDRGRSPTTGRSSSVQGPRSRDLLAVARPGGRRAAVLRPDDDEDRRRPGPRLADRLHRRPRLRDLGAGGRRADRLGRGLGGRAAARASSRSG